MGSALSLPSRREASALFCFHEERLVALHAFIKKSQKTLAEDMKIARQRMKDLSS
jgi:phage-related protein